MGGVRVELTIEPADPCPVAELTAETGAAADRVTWGAGESDVVEQFALSGPVDTLPDSVHPVFEYDDEGIYEFVRDEADCPCQFIEEHGHPISDVRVGDGHLIVTLHLVDGADFSTLLSELRDAFEDVSIRTIAREDAARSGGPELVPVDRGQLTDRQREVLRTAHAMGYFEYPRQANATEVADRLDICPSTFAEHLAAAQSKVLDDLCGAAEPHEEESPVEIDPS